MKNIKFLYMAHHVFLFKKNDFADFYKFNRRLNSVN